MLNNKKINYIFFGSGPLAESALFVLYKNDLVPSLIVTSPDRVSGRGMHIQKNIIATWAESKSINVWQPEKDEFNLESLKNRLGTGGELCVDVSIIVSFPKILKQDILDFAKCDALNIHPSALPKYRGPSPIQTALLNGDTETAVSIIKLDAEVDHGPLLIHQSVDIQRDETNEKLERRCGALGGEMLSQVLEHYVNGNMILEDQDHSKATFTKKFSKADGEIDLETCSATELQNKYKALLPHIPIYFFIKKKDDTLLRVKISEIELDRDMVKDKNAKDIIKKVIPENKSEMNFSDFEKGYLS